MPMLLLDALRAAPLSTDPFEHITVRQAVDVAFAGDIGRDYPVIVDSGSFSLSDAPPGPALQALIDELVSEQMRSVMAEKFAVDLIDRPVLVTLRGRCGPDDGKVHTDSRSKIISLLLYLNEDWGRGEGVLRLLRRKEDIESAAVEVPPTFGSLVAFRRSDRSFHGHLPFVGSRRVLQLNYLNSTRDSWIGSARHRFSALGKRLGASL